MEGAIFLVFSLTIFLMVPPAQSFSVHETLKLRRNMQRLMEAELNKGTLNPYEQYVYFNALEILGDKAFLTRKNATDERLFTPTIQPTNKPTTLTPSRPVCHGSRVMYKVVQVL